MKAIVVRQPYAALIIAGIKVIETRPAPPNGPMRPQGVRGLPGLAIEPGERIAICAAAAKPEDGSKVGPWSMVKGQPWRVVQRGTFPPVTDGTAYAHDLHFGAVVGTVVVAEALEMRRECGPVDHIAMWDSPASGNSSFDPPDGWVPCICRDDGNGSHDLDIDYPLGEYVPGRWGWLLADPVPCAPVPVTGRQGVFMLPDAVAEQVAS